jgi:hypothetical protein
MHHCTVDLLFDWFGISFVKTDNFCFYLQNRPIQTNQTGGQQYSDTSSFSIPWDNCLELSSGIPYQKELVNLLKKALKDQPKKLKYRLYAVILEH